MGYELHDTPKYCGEEEWDDSFPVSFRIRMNLRGDLSFGKWYELDQYYSFFRGEYGKIYEITDGKMRITEKSTEPKTNIDYYYGEFWNPNGSYMAIEGITSPGLLAWLLH